MGITWFQFHRGTDILESPCMAKKCKRESITQYSFHLKGITLGFRPELNDRTLGIYPRPQNFESFCHCTARLLTVLYFSVRSSRSRALRYGQPILHECQNYLGGGGSL